MRKLFIYLILKTAQLRCIFFNWWFYVREGFESANKTIKYGKHHVFEKGSFESFVEDIDNIIKYNWTQAESPMRNFQVKMAQSCKNALDSWHKLSS